MSTNFKIFKHFNLAASVNYLEVWQPKQLNIMTIIQLLIAVKKDTISGLSAFRTYNYGINMATNIYGTVNFKGDKKIRSIRHTIRPSISYSSAPSFDQYYDEYIIDMTEIRENIRVLKGVYLDTPSRGISKSMGISVNNVFEAKISRSRFNKNRIKKNSINQKLKF